MSRLLHELQEFPAVLLALSLSLPALLLRSLFRLAAVDQTLLLHLVEHLDQHSKGVSRGHAFLWLSVDCSELAVASVGGSL